MALIKCSECEREVSTEAKTCPGCGAKVKLPKKPTSPLLKWSLGVLVVGGIAMGQFNKSEQRAAEEAEQKRVATLTPEQRDAEYQAKLKAAAKLAEEAKKNQPIPETSWNYDDEKDAMSGGHIKRAYITSTNSVDFKFPYQGGSTGMLTIRKHPRYGKDVYFRVTKGQTLCGVDGCTVSVKFDDGKSASYRATGSNDNDSTVLFISGYDGFVKKAKASKQIIIEVGFYQEGNRQFTFATDGLKWD